MDALYLKDKHQKALAAIKAPNFWGSSRDWADIHQFAREIAAEQDRFWNELYAEVKRNSSALPHMTHLGPIVSEAIKDDVLDTISAALEWQEENEREPVVEEEFA
jgi:hypothetical protein